MGFIFETSGSRGATVGDRPDSTSAELKFQVQQAYDDAEAHALAQGELPAYFRGLPFQTYTIDEVAPGLWDVTAKYAPREPATLERPKTSFNLSGQQVHITNSLQTVGKYAPSGKDAPDFKGALCVEGDKVQGTDIDEAQFTFTETWVLPRAVVTSPYIRFLFSMYGKVNDAPFRGYDGGQIRFVGASDADRDQDNVEVTFQFAGSSNATDIQIGDILVPEKLGWDFLWVLYEEVEDETCKVLVRRPRAVYVERLFYFADYSRFGIGTDELGG